MPLMTGMMGWHVLDGVRLDGLAWQGLDWRARFGAYHADSCRCWLLVPGVLSRDGAISLVWWAHVGVSIAMSSYQQ